MAPHVTQRGNRRQDVFFEEADYLFYLETVSYWSQKYGVEVLAYCLMTKHIHLVAVPSTEHGLQEVMRETHLRYARRINFSKGWTGHLWQGRYASTPMDEPHMLMAVRYVELNPVCAGMVEGAEHYRWSSAKAHMEGKDDSLVKVSLLLELVPEWSRFLKQGIGSKEQERIRLHERTGRPMGRDSFIEELESRLGVTVQRPRYQAATGAGNGGTRFPFLRSAITSAR
ncbi:protein of unknown function DUF1568 [Magnetococcus marinus MC-1]|uniref:Transposase IS200-like domain-containing protein n=1 Tax=Magnetococcus marinus (strain ATCC BAA-1437 / JCM 17883 / MC-1) TaxID=156889 RepID=A0L930_MAGMM|nr:transposase [Magnetococcus marinus]ABK44473.1 protein of unknown function DUF1568 [Magnetococcus marinus MC-1]